MIYVYIIYLYMKMTVIIDRAELITYYNRCGYTDTSRRQPFPANDSRFGIPKENPTNVG